VSRCKAFFGGLEVQVSASMSRSPGVVPDIGALQWRAGTTQPGMFGDLVFKNDATTIVTFSDCILDDPQETRGEVITYTYRVKDRRWRWEYPVVFGEWNIRDQANKLISGTEKNPRELATLLLDALGETGYDVSVLSTDDELAPYVAWHYTSAAASLAALCDYMGVEVHLKNDNTVAIVAAGAGTVPDNTGLEIPVETGIVINPAPDNVTAYAGDTLFDDWLLLDACGMEIDGTVKTLEKLSYRPTNGWSQWSPEDIDGQEIYQSLPGGMSERNKQTTVDIAMRTAFRMYRVVGFARGITKPPTMPEEYAMPYSKAIDNDNVHLVDPTDMTSISTHVDELEAFYSSDGIVESDCIIIPKGHLAFNAKLVLPLEDSRLLYEKNMFGEDERKPAELYGVFQADGSDKLYSNLTVANVPCYPWLYGFSINPEKGYVMLNRPGYRFDTVAAEIFPARLYLRTGFRLRNRPYGERYHRTYTLSTGNSLGTANGVVARTDVQVLAIRDRPTEEYAPTENIASSDVSNLTEIDSILQKAATEYVKTFQSYIAPQRKQYTPLRAIDTNGKVQQVQYMTGNHTFGRTVAAVGAQWDFSQPTSRQKLQRFRDREQALKSSQSFTKSFVNRPQVEQLQVQTSPWRD
jgi:hypothetical protein